MNIISFTKLGSTNTYAKTNIEKLADKDVISTEIQTDGHGRFERKWVDLGAENIYMTIILKPSDKISSVYANLTQYLSVCLCKELEEMGLQPEIKWPNDVLLNGKKVCGILAESAIKGGKLKGIALGIGINLNAEPYTLGQIDRPATSINIEKGMPVNKEEFMQKLLERFFKDYDEFLQKGFLFIKKDYQNRTSIKQAQMLTIAIFNKEKQGEFKGFDDSGNLLLQTSGAIEAINMGEII